MRKFYIFIAIVLFFGVGLVLKFNKSSNEESKVVENGNNTEKMTIEEESKKGEDRDLGIELLGQWQSVEDSKSSKIFKSEGVVEEVYDGQIVSTGTWSFDGKREMGSLKIVMGGEDYVYTVVSLTENGLTLTYLPRGNTLVYERLFTSR
ncbi:MAG: hypothetical protein K9M15_00620 [Candidatus Marinimicrobia bacterium]|nr:hypothetical protein [Candidatus Neomarinimicrobiota bacterium]